MIYMEKPTLEATNILKLLNILFLNPKLKLSLDLNAYKSYSQILHKLCLSVGKYNE